jgi:hypothetical protein
MMYLLDAKQIAPTESSRGQFVSLDPLEIIEVRPGYGYRLGMLRVTMDNGTVWEGEGLTTDVDEAKEHAGV